MPRYRIVFEDMGVTDSGAAPRNRLSAVELGEFNDNTRLKNGFPSGVLAVLSAEVLPEGEKGASNLNVFMGVSLLVEADSQEEAEEFSAPVELLSRVASRVATPGQECAYEMTGWEYAGVYEVNEPVYEGGEPVRLPLSADQTPSRSTPRP